MFIRSKYYDYKNADYVKIINFIKSNMIENIIINDCDIYYILNVLNLIYKSMELFVLYVVKFNSKYPRYFSNESKV